MYKFKKLYVTLAICVEKNNYYMYNNKCIIWWAVCPIEIINEGKTNEILN